MARKGSKSASSVLPLVKAAQQKTCAFQQPVLFKESKPIGSAIPQEQTTKKPATTSAAVGNANQPAGAVEPGQTDEHGFTTLVKVLFPREKLAVKYDSVRRIGSGLKNYGNTCFCNATLQSLMYTAPLANYLASREHGLACRQRECVLCILEELYGQCSKAPDHAVAPKRLIQRLQHIDAEFSPWRQSDAHEFKIKLFEKIEKSLLTPYRSLNLDHASKATTVLNQIFGGYLQSRVQCTSCGYASLTYVQETVSSLEIPPGVDSLDSALKKFTASETLGRGNEWKCEKCKKKVQAQKSLAYYKPPTVLTFQLKRFSFSPRGGRAKISKPISFPETLLLRPYLAASQRKKLDPVYHLNAVIVHSGSAHAGHYYAYVKASNGVWHEMNDTSVTKASLQTVLKSNAYLLFYTVKNLDMLGETAAAAAAPQKQSQPQQKKRKLATGSALPLSPPLDPAPSVQPSTDDLLNSILAPVALLPPSAVLNTPPPSSPEVSSARVASPCPADSAEEKRRKRSATRARRRERQAMEAAAAAAAAATGGQDKPDASSKAPAVDVSPQVVQDGVSVWRVSDLPLDNVVVGQKRSYSDDSDAEFHHADDDDVEDEARPASSSKRSGAQNIVVVTNYVEMGPQVRGWAADGETSSAEALQMRYNHDYLQEQLRQQFKRRKGPNAYDADYDRGATKKAAKSEARREREQMQRQQGGLRHAFNTLSGNTGLAALQRPASAGKRR
ncbi:hypothetical protein RI367_004578 [Sorochytrium milnesiophthora]